MKDRSDLTLKTGERKKGPVYTLETLIHNFQAFSELKRREIRFKLSGGTSPPTEAIQEAVENINNSFFFQIQRENMMPCQK
ncbi:MAG: hypothetical protein JXB26_11160 [Candidatus Aminicenantes bacterium]|nr:hypothetical protein [Candidatus Aminicenantes bacterium]